MRPGRARDTRYNDICRGIGGQIARLQERASPTGGKYGLVPGLLQRTQFRGLAAFRGLGRIIRTSLPSHRRP